MTFPYICGPTSTPDINLGACHSLAAPSMKECHARGRNGDWMRTRLPAMASAPEAGVRLTSRSPRSIPGVRACHVAGTGNPPQSTIVLRSTLAWRRAFRNCLVLARPSAHWHASCRGQSAGALGVTCAVTSPTHRHMWRSTNDASVK